MSVARLILSTLVQWFYQTWVQIQREVKLWMSTSSIHSEVNIIILFSNAWRIVIIIGADGSVITSWDLLFRAFAQWFYPGSIPNQNKITNVPVFYQEVNMTFWTWFGNVQKVIIMHEMHDPSCVSWTTIRLRIAVMSMGY